MKYISTRGAEAQGVSSAYAIKTGLASDKGLFMPESIPALSIAEIEELIPLGYHERAAKILAKYLSDFSYDELIEDTSLAY